MVKIAFSIISFSLCVFLGIKASNKYKETIELINFIINFNKNLIINIDYKKDDLITFTKKYDKDNVVLKSYLRQIKKEKICFEFIKDKKIKNVLENYFYGLGKSNDISQKEYLCSYEKILLELLREYKTNNEKKMILYPKLGVFSGLIILVLLL